MRNEHNHQTVANCAKLVFWHFKVFFLSLLKQFYAEEKSNFCYARRSTVDGSHWY